MTLEKKRRGSIKINTDAAYSGIVSLRSTSSEGFIARNATNPLLPITSFNEDALLAFLGVPIAERNQIEGLHSSRDRRASAVHLMGLAVSEDQMSSQAIARFVSDPPLKVGSMQRRTTKWLVRAYPHGLRFSGKNMSPLPFWLAGVHYAALNMSNVDLAVQLHFALFNGANGYVLKPGEMVNVPDTGESEGGDPDLFWPNARERLHRTTIEFLSLHNLPKSGERRPSYQGSRGECHNYVPQFSGEHVPPDNRRQSVPALVFSLHQIGGFSAISTVLPVPHSQQSLQTNIRTFIAEGNGMNASFGASVVHCISAEPHTTFLRVGVTDRGREVAYETSVLGRLRCGYRVFHLRNLLGTRIELCYLFVAIRTGSELNQRATARQLRLTRGDHGELNDLRQRNGTLQDENGKLRQEFADMQLQLRSTIHGESNELQKQNGTLEDDNIQLREKIRRLTALRSAHSLDGLHI